MDEGYKEVVDRFYRIYNPLRKGHGLRMHMEFSIYGTGLIEIWEYEGERKKRRICRVAEENSRECYRRAAEELESYYRMMGSHKDKGKDNRNDRKAG